MKKTHIKQLMVILPLLFGMLLAPLMSLSAFAAVDYDYAITLGELQYTENGSSTTYGIENYASDDDGYESFLTAYEAGTLPIFYTTEFLFDGVGRYIPYDLDDLVSGTKTMTDFTPLEITVLNINTTGNVLLAGELDGMVAINTNGLANDLNLILNGVAINTNDKKVPAVYVYNKDITYADHKVTIKTVANSSNTIEGGKFKKISLMDKDTLANYASYYTGDNLTNFQNFQDYYGLYTAEEIENILFAKVQASSEDLQDGDPYYFYKGAGVISSDIDLYFEGEGYLEVTSNKKEGIESKGDLTFSGGTGDYYISALDDALNTTTAKTVAGAHNALTIDVNSLVAIVDAGADEGDAIDSNGTLTINGGVVYAIAHPTSGDDGLDSETGTYINGGTVVATGNMSDPISTDSTQAFIKTTFNPAMTADTVLAIVDSDGNPLAAYMSDRDYTVLTFSSPSLSSGASYSLYTDGTLNGTEDTHSPEGTSLYTSVSSYTGGTFLSNVTANTNPDNQPGGGDQPGPGGDTPPTPPSGEDNPPTPPNDVTPDPDDPSNDTPSNGGDNSSDNNTNDDDSTLVDGVPNDYLEDGETVILVEDNESVAVPSTSAYTVTYPSTGRSTKAESGSLRSTPSFAWAVSGCSAVALILYAVAERKKHAVRFQR